MTPASHSTAEWADVEYTAIHRGLDRRDTELDLIEQFTARFEALRGVVHTAPSEGDAALIALSICTGTSASTVALSNVPEEFQSIVEIHKVENKIKIYKTLDAAKKALLKKRKKRTQ